MKSSVSDEDSNLVLWDISKICHFRRINAYIAKIALSPYRDVPALRGGQLCSLTGVPRALGRGKGERETALPLL